jgi:hypothetical protein
MLTTMGLGVHSFQGHALLVDQVALPKTVRSDQILGTFLPSTGQTHTTLGVLLGPTESRQSLHCFVCKALRKAHRTRQFLAAPGTFCLLQGIGCLEQVFHLHRPICE